MLRNVLTGLGIVLISATAVADHKPGHAPPGSSGLTTLGDLECAPDEIAKFDGTDWVCGQAGTGTIADAAVTAAKLGLANTFFIEDSGDDAANCTELINTLAAVVSPAAVVLGPGTYACGTSPVVIPAGVSLIGSGRNLTTITEGATNIDGLVGIAGDDIALGHLTVTNDAAGGSSSFSVSVAVTIGAGSVDTRRWRISDVSVNAENGNIRTVGIFARSVDCDGGEMINIASSASSPLNIFAGIQIDCSAGSLTGTNLSAAAPGGVGLIHSGIGSITTVRNSALSGQTAVTHNFGTVKVISSELDGSVAGAVICVGNYDENGAPLTDGTNGVGSGCQ